MSPLLPGNIWQRWQHFLFVPIESKCRGHWGWSGTCHPVIHSTTPATKNMVSSECENHYSILAPTQAFYATQCWVWYCFKCLFFFPLTRADTIFLNVMFIGCSGFPDVAPVLFHALERRPPFFPLIHSLYNLNAIPFEDTLGTHNGRLGRIIK